MEKPKISQETRRKTLRDIFYWNASSSDYCWQDIPKKAQDRINRAFERLIDFIVDIDDMELLSIGSICNEFIYPLSDTVFLSEDDRRLKSNKNEKNPEDKSETMQPQNEISRREISRVILQDYVNHHVSSLNYYWKNIPQENQQRLYEVFGQIIESILDIGYIKTIHTDGIFNQYIRFFIDHAILVEVVKLSKAENNPEEK